MTSSSKHQSSANLATYPTSTSFGNTKNEIKGLKNNRAITKPRKMQGASHVCSLNRERNEK